MKQIDYSPGNFGQGFQVVQPVDTAGALAKEQQRSSRQIEQVMEFNRRQADQYDSMVAKLKGQDLIALGKLSETFGEQLTALNKTITENREADELYDQLFGGGVSPEQESNDEAVDVAAYEVANANAETANRVEQETGEPSIAQMAYTMDGGMAQHHVQSTVSLTQARTLYPAHMAAWMGSNEIINIGGQRMTVAQAVMSGNPALVTAAMTKGRQNFLRTYGLGAASRRQVIKTLGQTIVNTDASLASSAISQGVKQQRTNEIERITGLGYNVAKEGNLSTQQQDLTRLTNLFYTSPTGMTRAEANKAAVTALANGYAATGNVEAIDAMYGLYKVQNADGTYQKGTELKGQYSPILDKAREDALKQREGITSQRGKDIEADMYAQLAKPGLTPEQRRQVVENTAQLLEENDQHERARQIREQSTNLETSGSNQYNNARLEDGIRNGEVRTPDVIKQARLTGSITAEQEKNLLALLSSEGALANKMPNNQNFKDVLKAEQDRNTAGFIAATGNQRDQFGKVVQMTTGSLVTSGEAETITAAMEVEQRRVAVQAWNTASGSDEEKLIAVRKALQDWRRVNVEQAGGKYHVVARDTKNQWNKENQTYLKNLSNSPVALTEIRNGPATKPRDYTTIIDPGKRATPTLKSEFNGVRGDKVFTADEVQILRNHYLTNGGFQQGLIETADSLGMTPLALLNQQIMAHGGTPLSPIQFQQSQSSAPTSLLSGSQQLMSMGFPLRGAAYLAGNIQQESGWVGQRQPWDDGGKDSGGLVSWRAGRLSNAEQAFGPVEQASNQQQLNYMVQELRTKYPEAYRIFMNPRSTRRDLIRASKIFWGYGEEGKRYTYADQAEAQLRAQGSASNNATSYGKLAPKQRTVAVGKALLDQGYVIWQHPNFDADRGYVADGSARVGQHSTHSYHYVGQALDFPIGDNGRDKLNQLYTYLNSNRKQLGITELLWNVEGHYNHLHVSFG